MHRRIYILVYLIGAALHGMAQTDWQFNKEKKGIKVYTKDSDSSSFKSIKVEGVFDGSWERLSAILMDVKHMDEWVYRTKNSYIIKQISNKEVIYYTETTLPWPINGRYTIIHMKLIEDRLHNINKVAGVNEPDILSSKNGLIRTTYYKSFWQVKTLQKNKISIVFIVDINPGGSLPAWVVNLFITTGPFETFTRLAELLKK